jgi:MFS family permease
VSIQLDYERSARTRIPPWHVVAAVALNVVGASMLMTGIFFVMKHEHGWTTLQNLRLSAGQGACYVFGALLAARWAKRMGRAKGFALSSLAQAIPPAVLLLGPATPWLMIGVLLQYAFVNGSTWPILQSMLTSGADARNMSKRVGMYNLTWSGLGTVVLAVIGTILTLWPAGVWYIAIAAHLGAAGIVLSLRRVDRLAAEAPAETLPPEPALLRQRRQALWLSRIGLPASLVVVYIMLPMMPGLPVIQQLDVAQQTLVCSTWMAARWTMFAILGATSWWHTRPRIILLAGMVMLGTMLGVLLPPFDALGINLA